MVNQIDFAEEGSDSDFFQSYPRKSYIIAGLRWFFQQCFSLWVEMMLPELHLVKIVVFEFVQILSRW
jgi:hypothetical protein